MVRRNIIDRVYEYFSPNVAAKRLTARVQLDHFKNNVEQRRFEAASNGRRTSGWKTPSTDVNASFYGLLQKLRDRSRDLTRNNAHASRAIQVISTNTVGKGIRGEPIGRNKTQQAKISQAWDDWAGSLKCDVDKKSTFYGLQNLGVRSLAESGGFIIRKRRRKLSDKRSLPLQIQVLEPDFIDLTKNGTNGSNKIIQGIEFNSIGEPVAYYLFKEHPGNVSHYRSYKSERVSAKDIIYVYRLDRIGQIHGVPWGVSIFTRLKDFDGYEDAHLMRQKIAACFTGFIYDSNSGSGNYGATGLDKNKNSNVELVDTLEPGTIEILPPGKEIKLSSPPGVQNYGEYASSMLHSIASGYDIPYEAMTGDYSQVNYSSSRMTWLQFGRDLDTWQEHILVPQLCDVVFEWFLEALSLTGVNTDGVKMKWIMPRRDLIDPTKEIPAKIKAIRGGLTSHRRALREMGLNPDEIYDEIQHDNDLLDQKGIVVDSDPRKVTAGGTLQTLEDEEDAQEENN